MGPLRCVCVLMEGLFLLCSWQQGCECEPVHVCSRGLVSKLLHSSYLWRSSAPSRVQRRPRPRPRLPLRPPHTLHFPARLRCCWRVCSSSPCCSSGWAFYSARTTVGVDFDLYQRFLSALSGISLDSISAVDFSAVRSRRLFWFFLWFGFSFARDDSFFFFFPLFIFAAGLRNKLL